MKKLTVMFSVLLLVLCLSGAVAFGGEQGDVSLFLWRLVNQARAHPLEVLRAQGLDEGQARQALGADAGLLDTGLPPLAWNNLLARAADGHNREMVSTPYYSSIGLDGGSPAERIAACGYEARQADELLGAMAFAVYLEPVEAARLIFASWLVDELTPGQVAKRHIFSRAFTEAGFSFTGVVLDLGADIPPNIYAVVADFARPRQARAFLFGNIFHDTDGDGRFSGPEAVAGLSLWAWLPGELAAAVRISVGAGGAYQLKIPAAAFNLALVDEQGLVLAEHFFAGGGPECDNVLFDWPVPVLTSGP